jgi:hypothetical protein
MSNIRDAAMGFEAVKVSMSQDRNGIILRLNVHPNDCPSELHTDWVGTRYMVAMVRLNELCRNPEFGGYLHGVGLIDEVDPFKIENAAVEAVRKYCGITSRSEFRDNPDARSKFEKLREDFTEWKKS